MSEGIGQHSPAPPIIPQTQPHLPHAETASRLTMVPPRIITPASTAAPSSSSSSASASKPSTTTSSTAAAARTMASARDLSPHSHERRKSRSPRRHANATASSSSTSPPDRLAGLSSQRQLRQLERLAIQQSQTRQRTQHTSISPVAAGKRPALDNHHDDAAAPGGEAPDAKLSISGSSSSQQSAVGGANISPSMYKTRRGRSANVSPSRRWDRRGASATVLSGASASGSGSGEESEITVGPSHQRRLAGASTNRSSLPRAGTSTRRSRGRGGASVKMSPDIAAQQDDEGSDGLTSSDEEGALASRYARSRRASLERDRLRGMQVLMTASGSKSGGTSHEDLLNLASYDAATSASTSTSATPTTMTDDCSERSSMLSRTPSLEGSPVTSPIVAPAHVLPSSTHGRRKSRSRLNSTEAGSAAFFGLADDEEEPALSASALSAALAARPRSRDKSSNNSSISPSPDKVRSVPSSRRPSAPESATLGPATSSSVPNRASAILGFAPVSSSSSAAARFASLPRSNSRRQAMMLSLSRSLGGSSNGNVNGGDEIDLLSGSSIGSVEDLIRVDQVEWAPDADDAGKTSKALKGRRGSLIGVRTDEAQRTGTGDATVAALEAKSLMGSSESEAEPGSSSSVTTQSTSSRRTLPLLPKTPTAANSPLSSTSSSSPSKSQEQAPQAGFAVAYQERLSNLQSQLRLWASEANDANGQSASSSAEQQQQQQAGLLASSWRQIARLPNLLFPATKADKGAAASAVSSRSPSPSLADASSSASATPITSTPDSSGITLTGGVSSPGDAVPTNTRRRPSVGSRGVVDPIEGDRDPGAYVTGLGHRIDPDVELSSVVHLQSFRSRGRSVDARRPTSSSAPRPSHHAAHGERRTASDTEQSPALLSTKEGSKGSGSWEDAAAHTSVLPALDLPPAVKPLTRAKPQFTLHDDEDEHELPGATAPAAAARPSAPAPVPQHSNPAAQVDEDGFTKVVGRHSSSSSPRCSRPAAEAPVPMDWTAYGNGGNSTSSEESDADLSRSTTATVESTEDTRRHTIGRRSRATGDGEDGGIDEDDDDNEDGRLAPVRGRRGRGRGKGARVSSRANSPDAAVARNRQCAIGLFSSKPGSRRQDNSSDEYAAAAMKTVRSSPDLTYAGAAALGRGMSSTTEARSRSRNKAGGGGPQRPSRSRTTSSSSLKSGRDAAVNEDSSSSSSDDGGRGRGRGRAGSVKVTSSSFAASEHPPNSLPRSASASNLETMARRQSMMSAAALSTGTSGGPPPMPMSSAQHHQQPAPPATTAHGGLMSSWAYGGAKGAASPSAAGRSLSAPNASSLAGKGSGSDGASSSSSVSSASDVQQPLPLTPARPTLLSNSAHLLMLSLELEMMRAQKISAPLKVRWARQRAATAPPSPQMGSRAALQPAAVEEEHQAVMASADEAALEAAATDGPAPELVCAASSGDEADEAEDGSQATVMAAPALHRYAFQPRQASKLRHVING